MLGDQLFRGFIGCGTAMVTPFRKDSSLDEDALRRLARRQIAAGINFLVPCGTTGESPTLTQEEHLRVVAITLEEAKGKVPVLAGAGGYNTRHVIESAREIERMGADGILSVTPYYNKPTQEGLYYHFKAIAESISLPIILYNVPPRTNVNIEPATLRRLAEIPNIIGVKEASGNISQITQVFQQAPQDFLVFSGDDALTLPLVAMGGKGIISVASNEIPGEMTLLAKLCLAGNFTEARALQRKWLPLLEVNFIETNPVPVKAAMAEMGLLEPVYRLPLVPPRTENLAKIRSVLESLALLERVHVANRG
jgi:4-hydroxy-tetrahydrodipicolinate synthase